MRKSASSIPRSVRSSPAPRSLFFPVMASILTLVVFAGFSNTFYLRPITGAQGSIGTGPLPAHVILHGVIFTLWMALLLSQAWLIASRRVRIHKTVGMAGAVVAVLLVVSGALTTILFLPRAVSAGLGDRTITVIFLLDFASLLLFSVFVGLGITWRRHAATHKRLMYFATLAILGQALGGMNRPLGPFLAQFVPAPAYTGVVLFIVLLIAHDYSSARVLRKATIWGTAAIFAKFAFVGILSGQQTVQDAVLSLS